MSVDKAKTDFEIGNEVREYIRSIGIETPVVDEMLEHDSYKKIDTISELMAEVLQTLGLNLSDDSLSDTPRRIAKMYVNEIFWGLDYKNFPKITLIENKMKYDNMLLERHIKVNSVCEHHFIPMIGEAFIAYLPGDWIIGLSKINRIVEFFCRRPQVQERLTEQIFHTLRYILHTDNVAVLIRAEHTCVRLRGVEDTNSDTITSRLGGAFMEDLSLRNEFYSTVKL